MTQNPARLRGLRYAYWITHVCILHDLRALEPLRKSLPAVYAEVSRRAFSTEAGRFYVLDSISGEGAHAD